MRVKSKVILICMMALIVAFAASGSWAVTCGSPIGGGANTATIAVAANFVDGATALIEDCQSNGYCPNTAFTICQDSTAALRTEIENDYYNNTPNAFVTYSYFFAANTSASSYDSFNGTGTGCSYVKGIPVFFAKRATYSDVSHLVNGLSGYSYDITTTAAGYTVNITDAANVALANNSLAPYGAAGMNILNAMNPIYGSGYTLPSGKANWSWIHQTWFDDIGLTYDAVWAGTDGIKSGFVSKGQIWDASIPGVDPSVYIYVQFSNSAYALDQRAILLNANVAAGYLDYYIHTVLGCSGLGTFATGHGYGEPAAATCCR